MEKEKHLYDNYNKDIQSKNVINTNTQNLQNQNNNTNIPVLNINNQSQNIQMLEMAKMSSKKNDYQKIENQNKLDGTSSMNKTSSRTVREDFEEMGFLAQKYIMEKEKNYKLEAEKKTNLFRAEQQKKLTKKLISFSENQKMRIIKIMDFIICFFVLCDISLSVYTNMRFTSDELDINEKVYKEKFFTDQQIVDLRICIMCIVFLIEIFLIIKYHFKLKILRSALFASEQDNIFTTGLYKKMFLEMLIMLPFTFPELKGYFSGNMLFGRYTYSMDSFILLVKMSKLYYIVTVYTHISLWTSNTALDIAKEYKTSIGSNFILKATIKKTPTLSIVFMLILSVTLFSFMIRIFEYGFSMDTSGEMASAKAIRNAEFGSYIDVIWVVVISMTTVGYGDIYPKTHMGRLVAFSSSIVGMIIQSLLIVRLSDFVELTVDEKKAYNEIKKLDDQNKLEQLSCTLIKALFKLMKIRFDKNMTKKQNKQIKLNDANGISVEDLISSLRKKFDADVESLGPFKYLMEDVVNLSNKINQGEAQIHNSLQILHKKQEDIGKFVVELNRKKCMESKNERLY